MRKILLLFVLVLFSSLAYGQNYDLYVNCEYNANEAPWFGEGNLIVGGINIRERFNSSGPDNYYIDEHRSVSNTSYGWNASLDYNGRTYRYNETVSLGSTNSDYFQIESDDAGADWRGNIYLLEKIQIAQPTSEVKCYEDKIELVATPGHPSAGSVKPYVWQYRGVNKDTGLDGWDTYRTGGSTIQVSLKDLYDTNYEDYVNQRIDFRVYNARGDYESNLRDYKWIGCSIELRDTDPIQTTNPICNDGKTGTVTLNFKDNVESGYEMRYFIFQGDPSEFAGDLKEEEKDDFPNQVFDEVRLESLHDNEDGTFSGTYSLLEGINSDPNPPAGEENRQNYYIIYQEVDYTSNPVKVKSGEIIDRSFTIENPSKIVIDDISVQQPTCSTTSTGSATMTVSGGQDFTTGAYQYSKDNGATWQTSPTFNNLNQGETFIFRTKLVVSGSMECISSAEESRTIDTVTNALGINTNTGISKQPSSSSSNDGKIYIQVDGGTPNFTFELYLSSNPSTPVQSYVSPNADNFYEFENLNEGSYFVIVKDGTCDITSNTFILEAPPTPQLKILSTLPISCPGSGDGSLTARFTYPRNTVFSYELRDGATVIDNGATNGATDQNDITISGLGVGDYILYVISDNGDFSNSGTVTASNPGELIYTDPAPVVIQDTMIEDISCNGAQDGSILVTASGGTTYQYKLNPFDDWSDLIGNTIPITSGGFYDVFLRNQNGCEALPVEGLLVEEPDPIQVIETSVDTRSKGASDGSITLDISGGMPSLVPDIPYTISWEKEENGIYVAYADSDPTTPYTLVDLEAARYRAIINDASGCSTNPSPLEITVNEPGELLISIEQTVFLNCFGEDFGEITATVTGGVPEYTYEWFQITGGNNVPLAEETGIIGDLPVGTYFLRVTDVNGVFKDATEVTITQPNALSMSVDNVADVLCNGEETGAITFSATGGTPPYRYFLNGELATNNNSGLAVGEYFIGIYDDNGCEIEDVVTISGPDNPLQIANADISNASEYQATDGSIDLSVTGGLEPYTISWTRLSDNADLGKQNSISELRADTYEVAITDLNGCEAIEDYKITQPDVVEETIIQPTCFGDNDGSISLVVNKGNGSFTYSWSNGSTTNDITDLSAGSYTVTIDGFGDGPLTRTYIVENPVRLDVNLGEDKVLCHDQELVLDVTVADETATYEWTVDSVFLSSEPVLEIKESGNYTVTLRTTSGCMVTESIFVETTTNEIDAEFAISSQVFVDEPLIAVDISYPLPDNLEWILPAEATVIKKDNDEVELRFSTPGSYEIGIITIRGYCIAQQTKNIIVVAPEASIKKQDAEDGKNPIQAFIVYPNPSSGKFTADVKLNEVGNISIKIFNLTNNALMDSKNADGKISYTIPFDLSGLPPGVYAVLLETPYGNTLRKAILN